MFVYKVSQPFRLDFPVLPKPPVRSPSAASSTVSSIHSSFTTGNIRAKSAPQQEANGAYRCVELLELIAARVGVSSATISSIHSSFTTGNIRANSAEQQKANGLYRMVELLEAIAYALD